MIKWIPTLLIAAALFCLTAPTAFSRIIDLSNLKPKEKAYLAPFENKIVHSGFNQAPEIGDLFQSLAKDYDIEAAIETGTFMGATTQFLAACFNEVHTIEIVNDNFQKAYDSLKDRSSVHCHLGSSEKVLHQILPELKDKRVVFYLDAHWNEYWPLLDELEEISKTHRDNCIIVIDDFKVPRRHDIHFDRYGSNECSYKYIRAQLGKIYTHYDYYYVIPKNLASRAKFVAIPKKWIKQSAICKPKFEVASDFLRDLYRERLKNREVPRRRPDFESGAAGAEAAKLKKFSDAGRGPQSRIDFRGGGGSQSLWLSDAGRTDSSITSGICKS